MKKLHSTINILIIVFAIIIALFGGLLIAGSCSCHATAGGFKVDLSPVFSFFGLCFLIIGIWVLIKKVKKHKSILHVCIFIYGILLATASIFANYSSGNEIAKSHYEVGVLPPNGFSVFIACIAVIGLLSYPFIKKNQ